MGVERPEWLPAGWSVRVKVRDTGKKDKYYVNSSKGITLSSKPEVLRYLKCSGKDVGKDVKLKGSGKDEKPKEVTKSNIQKTVADNLPPGWIKEVRSRKTGSKTKSDKYYIDPISGRQFRSMQEVFRYLESKDLGEHAKSKPDDRDHVSMKLGYDSKSSSGGTKGQRLTDKNADKSLTGKRSVKSGSRFAVGLKDGSKENVSMPIEQGGDDDTDPELSDKLVDLVEKLADRKRRRKKLADNRVDKSADEDQRSKSGSKVENQDMPIQEHGDSKRGCVGGDLPHKLPQVNANEQVEGEGGRRRSMRLSVRKQKDKSLRSGSGGPAKKVIIPSESNMLEEKEKENNSTGDGKQQHESPSYNKKRKTLNNKSASDLPHRKPKRVARKEINLSSQSPEIKTSNQSGALVSSLPAGKLEEITAAKNNIGRSGPSEKQQIGTTALENSNEHNHSRCALEFYSTKSEEKPNEPSLPAGELEVTTAKNKIGRSGPSNKPQIGTTAHENSKKHNHSKCGPENSTKNEEKPNKPSPPAGELEVTTAKNNIGRSGPPNKSQIGTTAHKNSKENNNSKCGPENSTKNEEKPVISHDGKEDEKPCQKPEMKPQSALNDLLRDPCIEFAVKTLTGAIPIEEVNKVCGNPVSSSSLSPPHGSSTLSSNKSACGNIWTDPCFEFAAKILTGEVPVKEDGSQIRIAFQQPRDPSLDNVYPLDTFSQFAGVKNAWERQQGVKDPSLARAVNDGRGSSYGCELLSKDSKL